MRYIYTLLLWLPLMTSKANVSYHISFPEVSAHYVHVTMSFIAKKNETIVAKMPVWTPGSYKIREFSQHVDQFFALQGGKKIDVERRDKNTWLILSSTNEVVELHYDVYAFEFGVRTSYVDLNKVFLHGVSVFMYVEGRQKDVIDVEVLALPHWKSMHVALPQTAEKPWKFTCLNYDLLADSPIAIGNFDTIEYLSGGTNHRIVMLGKGNYDLKKVSADFKKITDEEVRIFGGKHPSDLYIHFIQNVDNGGGGLEHLNCQTSQVNRWVYNDDKKYLAFLGLVAHEYFHLWNVKRIRPLELGPFDYDKENYTDMLWIAEGITSYYDDLVLFRTGLHTQESYYDVLVGAINRFENMPGKSVMTLAESSKLAWIKGYYPNENSDNVTVSYYNKGLLVAWLLDMEIMRLTKGGKRLDDVMLALYDKSKKSAKGFTFPEFVATCNMVVGVDMNAFFKAYMYSTKSLDYQSYLKDVGITLVNKTDPKKADLGLKIRNEGGKCIVSYVNPTGASNKAGLSVNDEIIAIGGWRSTGDMSAELSRLEVNKEIDLLFTRDGVVSTTKITPLPDERLNYKFENDYNAIKSQVDRRKLWLPPSQ